LVHKSNEYSANHGKMSGLSLAKNQNNGASYWLFYF